MSRKNFFQIQVPEGRLGIKLWCYGRIGEVGAERCRQHIVSIDAVADAAPPAFHLDRVSRAQCQLQLVQLRLVKRPDSAAGTIIFCQRDCGDVITL